MSNTKARVVSKFELPIWSWSHVSRTFFHSDVYVIWMGSFATVQLAQKSPLDQDHISTQVGAYPWLCPPRWSVSELGLQNLFRDSLSISDYPSAGEGLCSLSHCLLCTDISATKMFHLFQMRRT